MAMRDEDLGAVLTPVEADDELWSPPMAAPARGPCDWQSLCEVARARAEAAEARVEELLQAERDARSRAGSLKWQLDRSRTKLTAAVEETAEVRSAAKDALFHQAEVARLEKLLAEAGVDSRKGANGRLRRENARLHKALERARGQDRARGQKDEIASLRKSERAAQASLSRESAKLRKALERTDRQKDTIEALRTELREAHKGTAWLADASRRYSTQTGDSELASLDESLSANLTRMRSFQERASLARQESESWSEQAAQVRSDAQAIERELGQPFFAWLLEQKGTDGRAIGAAGAMRIASPQTAEDSEQLREHAAAFIAEKFPAPAGPDPASVGGAAEYEGATGELREAYGRETAAAYGGWSAGVRDRAGEAGVPRPGEAPAKAMEERVETKTEMTMKGAAREARQTVTREEAAEGRAGIAAERSKPFEQQATENLPFIGGWLAGQLFGSAKNAAPDGAAERPPADESPDREPAPDRFRGPGQGGWGNSSP